MTDFARSLGARLAALRSAAGHSQESFAAAIGVCRNTVTGWEVGRFQPAIERVPAICRELMASPDELFGYDGSMSGHDDRRERAVTARLALVVPLPYVRAARAILALAARRVDD